MEDIALALSTKLSPRLNSLYFFIFAQRKSKSKVKLNSGLCSDFGVQLKVWLSERLSERLSQKSKVTHCNSSRCKRKQGTVASLGLAHSLCKQADSDATDTSPMLDTTIETQCTPCLKNAPTSKRHRSNYKHRF